MSKMIKCKTCNAEIASSAKMCPSCGAKNKKAIYKKWWFWVLAVIVVAGIAGGAGNDESSNGGSESNNTVSSGQTNDKKSEEVKEFYAVGEEVKLGDNVLIVNSVEKSSGSEWDKPKDGNEFVVVNVTIINGGSSEISYNPYDFKMQNSQGQITDQAFTTIDTETSLSNGELAGGGQVSGTIAFEQPVGDEELVLKYKANMFSNKEVKVKLN